METIKLQRHVGEDGVLLLELPADFKNVDVEITIAAQASEDNGEEVDALGYPIGFFERTYGAFKDTPIERPPQGEYEQRDEIL